MCFWIFDFSLYRRNCATLLSPCRYLIIMCANTQLWNSRMISCQGLWLPCSIFLDLSSGNQSLLLMIFYLYAKGLHIIIFFWFAFIRSNICDSSFISFCSLPCLLFFVCMRDTFTSEERKLKDPTRLYVPGRMFHIVERKFCRYASGF